MAITTKPGKATIDWRQGFAELSFIPVVSDWIELLASRLAQPLMFVSSLYIIAETTIPGVAAWSAWLDLSTRTVMSLAPEIILPGCFLQAQQSHRDGQERKARLLNILFGFCISLLALTLASFIWHFSDAINGAILFVRCGVGVTYTVILKIDKESVTVVAAQPTQPTAQPLPTHEDLAVLIAQSVENAVAPLRNELRSVQRFVQSAQQNYEITEIAQQPSPIEISSEQPSARPAIAQRSTVSKVISEQTEVSSEDEDAEQDDDTPLAQQDTQPVEAIKAQRNMRKEIFEFLESQPDPMNCTDDDVMAAIPGCTKSQSRRYRGQYKALKGGAQ